MPEPLLRVTGATKRYGTRLALDAVSVELHPHQITGLIGANGAGKTSLIRAIVGLLDLDEGRVDTRVPRATIGYLPEERGLYARHTPRRTLTYLARLRGLPTGEASREAERWLSRVDLPDTDRRGLEQFSKGQQQKAQLAATFMCSPALLLLDEPLSGLDPLNVQLVRALIDEASHRGAAILLSAHQLHLVEAWCDRVVMLRDGRIVLDEAVAAVRDGAGNLEHAFLQRTASPQEGDGK